MQYVDSHCHLDSIYDRLKLPLSHPFEDFSSKWKEGFDGCLTVFSDDFPSVMHFLNLNHPKIYGALGMHPHNASGYTEEFERQLLIHLEHPQVRALGEIGLDYHYTLSPKEVQKSVFERQARIAVEKGLPITIHTREAEADTMEILKKCVPRDHPFHIHCFTDSWEFAEEVLREWPNSFFGFTGVLTFKNSKSIQEVCKNIPMERLLSETDGPYMAPIPYRGKPSCPGYIPYIIEKIAELHSITPEEAYPILRENNRRLYNF